MHALMLAPGLVQGIVGRRKGLQVRTVFTTDSFMSTNDSRIMRADDFPLDLISLHLDDYDLVQQQVNEQHKEGAFLQQQQQQQQYATSLLQSTELLLHQQFSQYEPFPSLESNTEVFSVLQNHQEDDMAMDIQQFPTPTGSPLAIEIAPRGCATPLTISPGSTPSTTPGATPFNTPGHTPGVTPGHTPGVTPGSSPPGTSPAPSPSSSHPSSPRVHSVLMSHGLAALVTPFGPASTGSRAEVKAVKIPRHKRQSHISAEQRRRSKIQNGFDELTSLVPAIRDFCQNGNKDSKAGMLCKTVDFSRQLRAENKGLVKESDLIRREIDQLTAEIKLYQSQLPASGIAVNQPKKSSNSTSRGEELFEEYLKVQTKQNWKFWIFGLLIRPLFDAFNSNVTTSTTESFSRSVLEWLEEHCSLVNLRPALLNSLRLISTKTSIMDNPAVFPDEALAASESAIKTRPDSPSPVPSPTSPSSSSSR